MGVHMYLCNECQFHFLLCHTYVTPLLAAGWFRKSKDELDVHHLYITRDPEETPGTRGTESHTAAGAVSAAMYSTAAAALHTRTILAHQPSFVKCGATLKQAVTFDQSNQRRWFASCFLVRSSVRSLNSSPARGGRRD